MAKLNLKVKNYDSAIKQFKEYLEICPNKYECQILKLIGDAYFNFERYEHAI